MSGQVSFYAHSPAASVATLCGVTYRRLLRNPCETADGLNARAQPWSARIFENANLLN